MFKDIVATKTRVYGRDHPSTQESRTNLLRCNFLREPTG